MPPAHLPESQCRSKNQKPRGVEIEREGGGGGASPLSVGSRYKVINSTLLAHIHLIIELTVGHHVGYKKSFSGKMMFEH